MISSEIVITQADQGKTIEAHQGDVILLRLEENLTTGYEWETETMAGAVLETVESTYVQEQGKLMGRGGTRVVRFKAEASGNQEVHLKLRRSWEPPEKSLKRFDVTIKVR